MASVHNKNNVASIYDYKLAYIASLLKISHKQYESYVIHRIWHRLNDSSVLFIPQQHVGLTNNRYLIDLYLPQINLAIEVNEAYHKNSNQAVIDRQRREQIHKATGIDFAVVECYDRSITEINKDVQKIIRLIQIRLLIKRLTFSFEPWTGANEFEVCYYKKKKRIVVKPFRNYATKIDDIAAIFNATIKSRGYLRPGGTFLPNDPNTIIWWPSTINGAGWMNVINDEETEIIESNSNPTENQKHFLAHTNPPTTQKRITWFKEKNILGFNYYRFVGIFELDVKKSQAQNVTVWKRTSTMVDIPR